MPPSETSESCIPRQFFCPITQEVMKDPVVCTDGFSYERSAIVDWLRVNNTSPMTRQPIARYLHPNGALRQMIAEECGDMGFTPVVGASDTYATYVSANGNETVTTVQPDPGRLIKAAQRLRGAVDFAARLKWRYSFVWWLFIKRFVPVSLRHRCCKAADRALQGAGNTLKGTSAQVRERLSMNRVGRIVNTLDFACIIQFLIGGLWVRYDGTDRRFVVEGAGASAARILLAFLALR